MNGAVDPGEAGLGTVFDTDTTAAPETVSVIEDHPLFRTALVDVLGEAGLRIGAETDSLERFLAYRRPVGETVLLDLGLPGRSGSAAVLGLTELGYTALVVSASNERADLAGAFSAGAVGFVAKSCPAADLVRAVRTVLYGGRYVTPELAGMLVAVSEPPLTEPLSAREREVLALLARGDRDVDIAATLVISVRTVRSHLDRIRAKTGRRRRPDLTRFAIEHGLTASVPLRGLRVR